MQGRRSGGTVINTHIIGLKGEDKACSYLASKGYTIVERNYRIRGGEIDIIASKDELLVFCEVKTLPSGNIEILSHELNKSKQMKIIKTSKCYIKSHREYNSKYLRFDVIAVDLPGQEPVYHIEDAFSE